MASPPFTVRAVFEYASGHDDDLSFPIGQIVTVTAEEDDDWYYGEYTDGSGGKHEGIFPKNFVERYEPPAPPRPTRQSRPKMPAEPSPAETTEPVTETQPVPEAEVAEQPTTDDRDTIAQQPATAEPHSVVSSPTAADVQSAPSQQAEAPAAAAPAPAPAVKTSTKPPPPAVAEKPTGSSFKDRIAAFNKSTAAPVAPIKPGGQQPSSFIKKQFVAPPPSKDSYVAPPREPVTKAYRREEDPEVKEQLAREPPVSESRSPPPQLETEQGAEDQPKPTSLKDRIALLQKQQLEQAQRHAEAAQKKEKPKPPKKPVEQPTESVPPEEEAEVSVEPSGAARDPSVDTLRASAPQPQPATFSPSEEIASESNDADYSAGADSEDAGETSTSKEDEEEPSRQDSYPAVEQQGEEADEEDEQEEEMDPETKRRMELRNRMAKMSGGMGMMGLFGPPGGLPGMTAPGARKPKTPGESEKKLAEAEPTSPGAAPPVPLPGMNVAGKPAPPDVEKEEAEPLATPVTEQHTPREVPDVEDVVHQGAPLRRSTDRAPPIPPTNGMRFLKILEELVTHLVSSRASAPRIASCSACGAC